MIKKEGNTYTSSDGNKFKSLKDACVHQARIIVDNNTDPVEFFTNNQAVFERAKKLADQLENEFFRGEQ